MLTSTDQPNFGLRRRVRSYVIGASAGVIVSIGIALRILLAHDWRLLATLEIGWILIGVWIYLGITYQVLWWDGKVVMKALGRPDVAIAPDEIMQIGIDTADRMKLAGINTASPRIKILAKEPGGDTKSVYVSEGHFVTEDIRRLMQIISADRPDLTFPRRWIQNCDTLAGKS